MIRSEASELVMLRLGKRTGLDTDVIRELKQAQVDLEAGRVLPWFLKKALSLTAAIGTRTIALPSDFLRMGEEKLWRNATQVVTAGVYDELMSREISYTDDAGTVDMSSPYYAIVGMNLYQFPVPTAADAITGFYYAKDTTLASDIENEWLKWAAGTIIGRAGMRMAKTLRDGEAYGLFESDYKDAMAEMIASNVAREQAGISLICGG